MKFEIKNRWTGAVQVAVEIDASFESSSPRVQLGAAVRVALASKAVLRGAVLRGAVLRDFAVPSLHRQILAAIESGGSLDMEAWHKCETTHCRAGWAIQLAGAVGRTLEFCVGSNAAGALIHIASCPALDGKVPNFYATYEEALSDIRRLAELEPPIEVTEQSGA